MEVRDFMQAVGNNKQLLPTACIILCSRAQPYSFEHISYIVDKKKKKNSHNHSHIFYINEYN